MQLTLNVFHVQHGASVTWTTLGLGALTTSRRGSHVGKVQQSLLDELRAKLSALKSNELEHLEFHRNARLTPVHLELSLRDEGRKRKLSMRCPLVVETRWAAPDRPFVIAYHPYAQQQWFPLREGDELAEAATAYFNQAWASLSDEALAGMGAQGRMAIRAVALNVEVRTILDELPKKKRGPWDDLSRDKDREGKRGRGGMKVLSSIAEDLTQRCIQGDLPVPAPRARYREQLRALLTGGRRQPCVLVGPSGVGRSTLLAQAVHDLLAADDYGVHRNADRVRHVWQLSGRRIIAGMSHLGEWEQRCLDLVDDAQKRRAVLAVDDLHLFGRIGRSRDSDRNLAEFFRGPVQRGEIVLIGECTPAQWQRLEDDAPGFASLFTAVLIAPADDAETLKMMVQTRRELELDHHVEILFEAMRAVLEFGGALAPNRANPGKSVDLLRQLARENPGPKPPPGREAQGWIDPKVQRRLAEPDVVKLLAARTGLSPDLLAPSAPLPPDEVFNALSRNVIGQPEAIAAAVDLVARIRAGLVDPRRPYAVYLFTGPTGTGKTELARTLSRYLYGDESRLLRFDMAEYSGHDAVSRLVGDRWTPEGALTRAVAMQPFCVVLFDEIEKAHPAAHNLLLQLFEDGRLTDASGNTASFAHAVVVMTSNLGARAQGPAGFGERSITDDADHLRAVREFFAPELFNRIDRVVPFRALTREVARAVTEKELARLMQRRGLLDRNVFVTAAPAVLDRAVEHAFRSADGARSLKRYLEDTVATRLTEHLVSGASAELQMVRIHAVPDGLSLEVDALAEAPGCADAFPLLDLIDAPVPTLRAKLPGALAEVDALMESAALKDLADEVSARLEEVRAQGVESDPDGAIYTLDQLRADARRFRDELDALARAARAEEDWDLHALELFSREHSVTAQRTVSVFARRSIAGEPPPLREALLHALSQAHGLRRRLALIRDPLQHSAFVHIERSDGSGPRSHIENTHTLFMSLCAAYATELGQCVELAYPSRQGVVTKTAWRASPLLHAVDAMTLKLTGPCVLDALSLEHGTHIWHRASDAPEVVRVRVEAAPRGRSTIDALRGRLTAREARDEAARRGRAFEDEPLPVVRTIRFERPLRERDSAPWSMEDFVLSHVRETTAREVTAPLHALWSLRAARVTPG